MGIEWGSAVSRTIKGSENSAGSSKVRFQLHEPSTLWPWADLWKAFGNSRFPIWTTRSRSHRLETRHNSTWIADRLVKADLRGNWVSIFAIRMNNPRARVYTHVNLRPLPPYTAFTPLILISFKPNGFLIGLLALFHLRKNLGPPHRISIN